MFAKFSHRKKGMTFLSVHLNQMSVDLIRGQIIANLRAPTSGTVKQADHC
jgi:hypothetical protein